MANSIMEPSPKQRYYARRIAEDTGISLPEEETSEAYSGYIAMNATKPTLKQKEEAAKIAEDTGISLPEEGTRTAYKDYIDTNRVKPTLKQREYVGKIAGILNISLPEKETKTAYAEFVDANKDVYFQKKVELANAVNILDYARYQGMELKKNGRDYKVKNYSGGFIITPEKNKWNWFAENQGGGVIQLCMFLENKTFSEAVDALVDDDMESIRRPPDWKPEPEPPKEFNLPQKNNTNRHVYAYLTKTRGIDEEIVKDMLDKGHIYENRHKSCVFVGRDQEGVPRHASVRSTNLSGEAYKKDVYGSQKKFSFSISGTSGNLNVFEAPIDALSYMSLQKRQESPADDSYLSLGGVSDKALEQYLTDHADIKQITVCTDGDKAGENALERIKEKYGTEYEIIRQRSMHKDFNEDLISIVQEENFRRSLHEAASGKSMADGIILIGPTPNILAVCGAEKGLDFIISKKAVDKCMRPEIRDAEGRLEKNAGYGLTEEQLYAALLNVKEPVMVLKGSRENSLVVITEYPDDKNRPIAVSIMLDKKSGRTIINNVSSVYGKDKFEEYMIRQMQADNILAIDNKKAERLLQPIGKWYPKRGKVISYDETIAYTLENVKFPEKEDTVENSVPQSEPEVSLTPTYEERIKKQNKIVDEKSAEVSKQSKQLTEQMKNGDYTNLNVKLQDYLDSMENLTHSVADRTKMRFEEMNKKDWNRLLERDQWIKLEQPKELPTEYFEDSSIEKVELLYELEEMHEQEIKSFLAEQINSPDKFYLGYVNGRKELIFRAPVFDSEEYYVSGQATEDYRQGHKSLKELAAGIYDRSDLISLMVDEGHLNHEEKEKSFAQQVDEVLAGNSSRYSALKVCDTPEILLKAGCEQLPMFYTQKHLRDALRPKGNKGASVHHHGLDVEQIKAVPELLRNPVMIYDSLSRNDSIVVVTSEMDAGNSPIVVIVRPNGEAKYEMEVVSSNFVLSIHGRDNFGSQLANAMEANKILYCDKQKSQELFSVLGLQLPQGFNNLDFDRIIHPSSNIVNSKNVIPEGNKENDHPMMGVNITTDIHEDFTGEDFTGEDFTGVKFQGNKMIETVFTECNFTDALIESEITDTEFIRCNFKNAQIQNTTMEYSDLRENNFEGTNFQGVSIKESSLCRNDFLNSKMGAVYLSNNFVEDNINGNTIQFITEGLFKEEAEMIRRKCMEELNIQRVPVAIESTMDYEDPEIGFTRFAAGDMPAGIKYRLVTYGEDGKLVPYQDAPMIYNDQAKIEEYIEEHKDELEIDFYDNMVYEAGKKNAEYIRKQNQLIEEGLQNFSFDEEGYLHFSININDSSYEGLYRIYDPEKGRSRTLVSIKNGEKEPFFEKNWELITRNLEMYVNEHPVTGAGGEIIPREKASVYCEWSEHDAFEGERVYSVPDFDRLMKQADTEWRELRQKERDQYGDADTAFKSLHEQGMPQHQGYAKVKYTVYVPGMAPLALRQDVGDGYNGMVDFIKRTMYKNYGDILDKEMVQEKLLEDNIEEPEQAEPERSDTEPVEELNDKKEEHMQKFEVGKKYVFGHVEFVGPVTAEVVSRTEKFATFKKFGEEKKIKLKDWGNREVAFWGDILIDALEEEEMRELRQKEREQYGDIDQTIIQTNEGTGLQNGGDSRQGIRKDDAVLQEPSLQEFSEKSYADFAAAHQQALKETEVSRIPVVINAFGGPGSGKSVSCMDICQQLKKLGYNAEYVQEYAKELVYDENWEMLNGSPDNQFEVLKEQLRRVDRLYEKADFIVTDSPVLLNGVYNKALTPEYDAMVTSLYNDFENFTYFVERDASAYQQEGRIQNLEESQRIDQDIKQLLGDKGIYYGTYNHDTIDKIVSNAIRTFNRVNQTGEEVTKKQTAYAEKIANTLGIALPEEKTKAAYKAFISENQERFSMINAPLREEKASADNYQDYLQMVSENGSSLKDVPKEHYTDELFLAAVSSWGSAIRLIPEERISAEIAMASVQQFGLNLKYVPEKLKSEDICVAAYVSSSGKSVRYTPNAIKDRVKEQGQEQLMQDDKAAPDTKRQLEGEKLQEQGQKWAAQIDNMLKEHESDPDAMVEDIAFASKFYKYSVKNVQIMRQQNKGITYVASAAGFEKMGYHIKDNEQALIGRVPVISRYITDEQGERIYSQNYTSEIKQKIKEGLLKEKEAVRKFKFVSAFYDISQTDCPVENYPSIFHMGVPSEFHQEAFDAMKEFAEKTLGFKVMVTDFKSISLRGSCEPDNKIIRINDRLESTMALSTLCHEIAHGIIHTSENSRKITSAQKECEADVMDIMLESSLGLPVNESRRDHLFQSFHAYKEEQAAKERPYEVTLEKLIDRVQTKVFRPYTEDINHYLDLYLPAEGSRNEIAAESVIKSIALLDSVYETDHSGVIGRRREVFDTSRIEAYQEMYQRTRKEYRLNNSFVPKLAILKSMNKEDFYLHDVQLLDGKTAELIKTHPEKISAEHLPYNIEAGNILALKESVLADSRFYLVDKRGIKDVTKSLPDKFTDQENMINCGFDVETEYQCLHNLLENEIELEPEYRKRYEYLCNKFDFSKHLDTDSGMRLMAQINLITEGLSRNNRELIAEYVFRTGNFEKAEDYAKQIEDEPGITRKLLQEMKLADSYKYMLWTIEQYENSKDISEEHRITTGAYNSSAIPILSENVNSLSQINNAFLLVRKYASSESIKYYAIVEEDKVFRIAYVDLNEYQPETVYSTVSFKTYLEAEDFYDLFLENPKTRLVKGDQAENLVKLENRENQIALSDITSIGKTIASEKQQYKEMGIDEEGALELLRTEIKDTYPDIRRVGATETDNDLLILKDFKKKVAYYGEERFIELCNLKNFTDADAIQESFELNKWLARQNELLAEMDYAGSADVKKCVEAARECIVTNTDIELAFNAIDSAVMSAEFSNLEAEFEGFEEYNGVLDTLKTAHVAQDKFCYVDFDAEPGPYLYTSDRAGNIYRKPLRDEWDGSVRELNIRLKESGYEICSSLDDFKAYSANNRLGIFDPSAKDRNNAYIQILESTNDMLPENRILSVYDFKKSVDRLYSDSGEFSDDITYKLVTRKDKEIHSYIDTYSGNREQNVYEQLYGKVHEQEPELSRVISRQYYQDMVSFNENHQIRPLLEQLKKQDKPIGDSDELNALMESNEKLKKEIRKLDLSPADAELLKLNAGSIQTEQIANMERQMQMNQQAKQQRAARQQQEMAM